MATVVCSPADEHGSPAHIDRPQTGESNGSQEPSRSRSERGSRDGEDKDGIGETHRESVFEDIRDGPGSPEEMRPSEVIRVNSEIDSFVHRNRQASVAHVKLRPQASIAHLAGDHPVELYDVVNAVSRRNSLLGHGEGKKDDRAGEPRQEIGRAHV